MNVYTKHNTIHHDPEITEGQALLYLGTPSHTTCPYDIYARLLAKDARTAFLRGGIQAEVHCCYRRISSLASGSGRGGGVRMGDDMLPPDVQAVVATEDYGRAARVWQEWQARRAFRRPVSVIGNLWWDGSSWRRECTWPHVVTNALALAEFLQRDTKKIKAYAAARLSKQIPAA